MNKPIHFATDSSNNYVVHFAPDGAPFAPDGHGWTSPIIGWALTEAATIVPVVIETSDNQANVYIASDVLDGDADWHVCAAPGCR